MIYKILLLINILIINCIKCNKKPNEEKCKVLALEGGGDKGAYQAGVFYGLVSNLNQNQTNYDVITGVSIGSINAAFLALFEKGNELEAGKQLMEQWHEITVKNVYQNWPYAGPLYGLFFENSLFDTSNGFTFVNKTLSRYDGLKKDVFIGATNVKTGDYETYTNKDLKTTEDITHALLSSAAIPVFFPFGSVNNKTYMDGGVKYNLDAFSGIRSCKSKGFSNEDIIVDIILCSNKTLSEYTNPDVLSPIGSTLRFIEIYRYDSSMDAIRDIDLYVKNVTVRYVVAPSQKLPTSIIPLNFDRESLEKMMKIGMDDAKKIIELGEGVNYNKLLEETNTLKKRAFQGRIRINKKNENENQSSSSVLKFLS